MSDINESNVKKEPTMTTKHSPPPWESIDISIGSASVLIQLCSHGRGVMVLHHDGSPEGHANATLMAAAPKLLNALEQIRFESDDPCADERTIDELHAQLTQTTNICNRALSEVKGETNDQVVA